MMIRKILPTLAIAALTMTSTGAFARDGIVLSQDKHLAFTTPSAGGKITPNFVHKSKASVIYSNLASDYPNGLYFSGEGDTLCGATCALGESISVGGGFTPSANATAVEVSAAVGYIEGTKSFTLAIYSDNSGAPGKELWSGIAKTLPVFGECCGLATVKIKGGVALTGGTPYWVVAEAGKGEGTTFAAWNLATTNQITAAPAAYNNSGTGWTGYTTNVPPAFAVYSK